MKIVFFFYDRMTALDAIGPHEVLSRLPEVSLYRVGKNAGPVHTDSGLILNADFSFSAVSDADLLLIPGGGCAKTFKTDEEVLNWIRKIHSTTKWTVSVCTGSLILGAAGLLKGIKATSHWAALDRLKSYGAYPVSERVVVDGKIITSAGVSAGIDLAFTLAAKIAGKSVAQGLQLGLEYDPEPPFNGSLKDAPKDVVEALRARIQAKFEP